MKYILDTNVISELHKPNCNQNVKYFTDKLSWKDVYLSVITIGEICKGVEKLPAGKKKHELSILLYSTIPEVFNRRIIKLDKEVMLEWGKIYAKTPRTLPILDSLIAATAITHRMFLVTRNVKDFDGIEGINIFNPWEFEV